MGVASLSRSVSLSKIFLEHLFQRPAGCRWLSRTQEPPCLRPPEQPRPDIWPRAFCNLFRWVHLIRGVGVQEVCRTDWVMEVDQGKTPSYGAYFILTTKDVPPSAGKCRYDRIFSFRICGRVTREAAFTAYLQFFICSRRI